MDFRTPPDRLTRPGVVIVGFTEHRKLAFDGTFPRDRWEVWCLNELHRYEDAAKVDRWFEIHPRADLEGDPDHLKALAAMDIPVYMQQHWSDIPSSVAFPKSDVEDAVGSTYFTSSPAWMVGHAILLGAREIAVVGIDLAQESEYARERPCMEYLIGVARGRGITVHVPETSDLLKSVGQYGFSPEGRGFRLKLAERIKWLHNQDNEWLAQIRGIDAEYGEKSKALENEYRSKREQLLANRYRVLGAIDDCEYLLRSWAIAGDGAPGKPTPDRTQDARTGIQQQSDTNRIAGVMQEA